MALAPDIAKSIVNDLLTTGRSSWDQLGEKYGQENVDGVLKIFSQQKTRGVDTETPMVNFMASYGIPSDQSARLYFKATGTNSATSNDINTLANNLDVNKIQVDRANRTAQGFPPTPLTRKEFDQYFYGGDKEHYIKIEGGNQNFVGKMANIEKLWTQFSNDPNGAQKLQDINKPATVNPSVAQYMKVLSSMSGSKDYYGSIPDAQKGYIIDAGGYSLAEKLRDQYRQGVDITTDPDFQKATPAQQSDALGKMGQNDLTWMNREFRPTYLRYKAGGTGPVLQYATESTKNAIAQQAQAQGYTFNPATGTMTSNTASSSGSSSSSMTPEKWAGMNATSRDLYLRDNPTPSFANPPPPNNNIDQRGTTNATSGTTSTSSNSSSNSSSMATYTDQQYINAIKQVYGNNIDPGLLQTYLNSAKTGYGAIWNNINSKLSAPPTQTPPPTYNPAPPASSGSGSYGTGDNGYGNTTPPPTYNPPTSTPPSSGSGNQNMGMVDGRIVIKKPDGTILIQGGSDGDTGGWMPLDQYNQDKSSGSVQHNPWTPGNTVGNTPPPNITITPAGPYQPGNSSTGSDYDQVASKYGSTGGLNDFLTQLNQGYTGAQDRYNQILQGAQQTNQSNQQNLNNYSTAMGNYQNKQSALGDQFQNQQMGMLNQGYSQANNLLFGSGGQPTQPPQPNGVDIFNQSQGYQQPYQQQPQQMGMMKPPAPIQKPVSTMGINTRGTSAMMEQERKKKEQEKLLQPAGIGGAPYDTMNFAQRKPGMRNNMLNRDAMPTNPMAPQAPATSTPTTQPQMGMMQRPRVQQSPQPVSTQVTPISTAMSQRPDTGMMRRPPENGTWLQQHPNGGILAQGQRPQQQTGYQQQNPYANIQSYSQGGGLFGDTNRTQQQTQNALNAYAGTAGNIWNQQQGYANDIFNRGNTQLNTDVNAQNAQAFANQQQALQGQTRENARAADLARVGLGRLGALGNTSQSLLTLGDVGQRGQEQLGNLNQQFGAQQLQQNAQALQGRNQLSDIYQNRLAGIGQGQLGTVQDIYGNQNQLNNNYLNQRGQIVNQGAQNAINQGQGQVGISQGNQNWQGNLGNQAYQTINNLQQQQQQMNNDYQNQRAQIMQNLAGNDVARATALQQLETEFFNNQRAVEMQKLQAEEQARVNDRNFYNADRAYGLDYATTQYNINQPSSGYSSNSGDYLP